MLMKKTPSHFEPRLVFIISFVLCLYFFTSPLIIYFFYNPLNQSFLSIILNPNELIDNIAYVFSAFIAYLLASRLLRKVNEDKLKFEVFKKFSEASEQGMGWLDLEGKVVYANNSLLKMMKVKKENFLGKVFHDFSFSEEIKTVFKNEIYPRLLEGGTWSGELDSTFQNYFPIMDDNGEILYFALVFTDMSLIRQASSALKSSEDKLHTLFSSMTEMVAIHEVIYDEKKNPIDYRIIDCNRAYTKITGLLRENVLGKLATEVYQTSEAPYLKEFTTVAENLIPYEFSTFYPPMNKYFMISVVSPQKGFFATITSDISAQKKAELELINAKEKAEESDRLKSVFLANMSHEIRTPMNGILGFADLLKDPNLNPHEQQEYIKIIESSGQRMMNLINDLIDISKIESGQAKIIFSRIDIGDLLKKISLLFKKEAELKGLKLTLLSQFDEKNPLFIYSDKDKLYAILTNLVKNAIKYTHDGSIDIFHSTEGKFIKFRVKDTGIGIAKENLEKIFERFVQADLTPTKGYEGAGLGLSIAKAYVDLLGGKMSLKSELGFGSTFEFEIPMEEKYNEQALALKNKNLEGLELKVNDLKILITDDDKIVDALLTVLLKKNCRELLHAQNGREAVDCCQKNKDIDIVLMDIKMPEMDGYEAITKIREFNKTIPILVQSAFAYETDRQKAFEVGANAFISKPIQKQELYDSIESLVQR